VSRVHRKPAGGEEQAFEMAQFYSVPGIRGRRNGRRTLFLPGDKCRSTSRKQFALANASQGCNEDQRLFANLQSFLKRSDFAGS
jgi:hypothetical protein